MSWLDTLEQHLNSEEGYKNHLYRDSKGLWTIGIGYNIDQLGLPDDIIQMLFQRTVDAAVKDIRRLVPGFDSLSDARKVVLADMMFNMGYDRLSGFRKMLAALNRRDWNTAADEMVDSDWYNQVGNRGPALVDMMRKG